MDFWERLKAEIKRKNTTQEHLSAEIGVPFGTLRKWLSRKTMPNADAAVAIAHALGVSVEYLVTGADREDPWLREHASFLCDCKLLEEAAAERFGVLERSAHAEAETMRSSALSKAAQARKA